MSLNLEDFFGFLEKELPNYERRIPQLDMARAVFNTLCNGRRLLVEAGTGTGKSFAYLIPALLSGGKTIISTATIALQEQLATKDLSFLQRLGFKPFTYGILKGKNNYLCIKRLRDYGTLNTWDPQFIEWVKETETGDKDDLKHLPEFWNQVSGDSLDCAAKACPFYGQCFYFRNYKTLYKADIVIANHYILAFDALSGGSLLPIHESLIIDEAHNIDDCLSKAAGISVTERRIKGLLNRLRSLKVAVEDIYQDIDNFFNVPGLFKADLNYLTPIPEEIIEGLKHINKRLALNRTAERLERQKYSYEEDKELQDKIITTIALCTSLQSDIDDFLEQGKEDRVYFIQKGRQGFELQSRLIETASMFNTMIDLYDNVIMTSATLTTSMSFDFIKQRLNLRGFDELIVSSPFDYQRQSALFTDSKIPPPTKEEDFFRHSAESISKLICASKGRALVLFASYKHLRHVSEMLALPYPLASQGDMPNSKLLQWFIDTPDSVLLATQSFWQGIDVKGDKLSLLIIAKIPFASPGDPVYDARCRRLGDRWFSDLALPAAILSIRQGFGRLIRSASDRGVVAILDSRLYNSSYGSKVLSSLPKMTTLDSIIEVEDFLNKQDKN